MNPEPGSLAEYFDGWYAGKTVSPVIDEIHLRKDPQVAWWREGGWKLLDHRPDSR